MLGLRRFPILWSVVAGLNPPKKRRLMHQRFDTSSVGLEIGGCIAVGYFLGVWIDGQLESAPWATLIGLGLGLGAAVKGVLRVVRRYRRELVAAQEDG